MGSKKGKTAKGLCGGRMFRHWNKRERGEGTGSRKSASGLVSLLTKHHMGRGCPGCLLCVYTADPAAGTLLPVDFVLVRS